MRFRRLHLSCTKDDIKQTIHAKMRKDSLRIFSLIISGKSHIDSISFQSRKESLNAFDGNHLFSPITLCISFVKGLAYPLLRFIPWKPVLIKGHGSNDNLIRSRGYGTRPSWIHFSGQRVNSPGFQQETSQLSISSQSF